MEQLAKDMFRWTIFSQGFLKFLLFVVVLECVCVGLFNPNNILVMILLTAVPGEWGWDPETNS